jgi:hypothetical protein
MTGEQAEALAATLNAFLPGACAGSSYPDAFADAMDDSAGEWFVYVGTPDVTVEEDAP